MPAAQSSRPTWAASPQVLAGGGGGEEITPPISIPSLSPADLWRLKLCHGGGSRGEGVGEAGGRREREGGGAPAAGRAPLRGLPSPGAGHARAAPRSLPVVIIINFLFLGVEKNPKRRKRKESSGGALRRRGPQRGRAMARSGALPPRSVVFPRTNPPLRLRSGRRAVPPPAVPRRRLPSPPLRPTRAAHPRCPGAVRSVVLQGETPRRCMRETSCLPAGCPRGRGARLPRLVLRYITHPSPCSSAALSLGVIVKLFLQKPPKEVLGVPKNSVNRKREKWRILFG